MNPQLEFFLEDAFNSVRPTSAEVGRVVVEPDYDVSPDEQERDELANELVRCIQDHSPKAIGVASPQGVELAVPSKYPVLAKYVRSITLYQAPAEFPWVEVAPPGNWI